MLRVLACYIDGGLRPETYRALIRYVPVGSLEMVNTTGDLSTYWLEFRKRWNGKHDLMTVEQDNVIDSEMIPSFNMCDKPWCTYEYEGPHNMVSRGAPDRYLKTSLGCTRFSQALQQDVAVTEISRKDYFAWYLIDYKIAVVLGKKGIKPHVHGVVRHLHDYTDNQDQIRKEDEIYVEAMNKTLKDPEAVLDHPGMEIADGQQAWDGVISYTKAPDNDPGKRKADHRQKNKE